MLFLSWRRTTSINSTSTNSHYSARTNSNCKTKR